MEDGNEDGEEEEEQEEAPQIRALWKPLAFEYVT